MANEIPIQHSYDASTASFGVPEESVHDGRPITLYKFTFGELPEDEYRYTDADTVHTLDDKPYMPVAISRGDITSTGTLDRTAMEIRMQRDTEIAEIFRIYPPSYTVSLVIYQGHEGDPDNQFLAAWSGRVLGCSWELSENVFTCEPVSTSLRRSGLRRNYQRNCPHALYGPQCRAPRVPFDTTCSAIYVRNTITVASVGPDSTLFTRGTVEWLTTTGRREVMGILGITADGHLQLVGTPATLEVGMQIRLFKGCDHTMADHGCMMHNNILNYGGQPWIPLKNPIGSLTEFN